MFSVRGSALQHERTEDGVFASLNSAWKSVARPYYGWLAYADFKEKHCSRKRYGGRYIEVTGQSFRKWAVEVEGRVFGSRGQAYSV